MKGITIAVIILSVLLASCQQMNLGPKTDVLENGAGGRWKLSAFSVKGQPKLVTGVPEKALLQVERTEVRADSTYPSKIYVKGYSYRVFHFSDLAGANGFVTKAISYHHDYSKSGKEESHWFRLDDEYGFQVVLNLKDGKSTRMEMSNVMKSGEAYRAELDTARYIYVADSQ